jgi:hypothetical protein
VATPEPTFTVKVEALPAVTEVGLSEAVGPAGETLAARLTVPAEPLVTAVLIVEVELPPCWIDRLVGLALIEKSLFTGAVTVTVTDVLCVLLPSVPVTVTV